MRPAQARSATLIGLLAGGVLAQVASAQPWWRVSGGGASAALRGTEATQGLSQALAVVALAGTLLVLVLRVHGRRVVAVLLGLTGAATCAVGALRLRPSAEVVRTRIRQVSLTDAYAVTPTVWPWVFGLGGLLVTVGALLLFVGAASWPARADRFSRSQSSAVTDDPADLWRALDAGVDPTVEPRSRTGAG